MSALRKTLLVGAAVLVGAAGSLVAASPAMAVPGLIVTIDWSDETGSEGFKSAQATCPAGTVVLGGGADILDGAGQVRLASLIPFDNGINKDTFFGAAVEQLGFSGNWTMYTWAICGSGVTGWQKVTNTVESDGTVNVIGSTVSCPAGKKVIGTGANITGNVNFTFLDTVQPTSSSLASAYAEGAREETATDKVIKINTHAICINPIPGQQLVTATTGYNSNSAKYVSVNCPAGTKLHGTGGSISGALGQAAIDRVGLIGLGAVEGADIEAREDLTGYTGTWSATAFAICAN